MGISGRLSAAIFVPLAGAALSATGGEGLVFGNVSGWTVFTDPAQAYRCFAEVQYEGGTLVGVGFDASNAGLYLSVADPEWRGIAAGSEHLAHLRFDEEAEHTVDGRGVAQADDRIGGIRLQIPAPQREAFLSDFIASHTLTITIEGRDPLDLSLAGSSRATAMLRDCRSSMARHASAAP